MESRYIKDMYAWLAPPPDYMLFAAKIALPDNGYPEVDKSSIPELAMLPESEEHYSVVWFQRCDDQWYVCLRSEDTYHLAVDTKKIQFPHPINLNPALVQSRFHPNTRDRNPHDRRSRNYLVTGDDVKFVRGEPLPFRSSYQ
ncbi:hypothetical protein HOY82DRAFT_600343 [Tuber indicum]|nr:hypothetical protein HOY82DRAFT_600343 [Tuber indicum]